MIQLFKDQSEYTQDQTLMLWNKLYSRLWVNMGRDFIEYLLHGLSYQDVGLLQGCTLCPVCLLRPAALWELLFFSKPTSDQTETEKNTILNWLFMWE